MMKINSEFGDVWIIFEEQFEVVVEGKIDDVLGFSEYKFEVCQVRVFLFYYGEGCVGDV